MYIEYVKTCNTKKLFFLKRGFSEKGFFMSKKNRLKNVNLAILPVVEQVASLDVEPSAKDIKNVEIAQAVVIDEHDKSTRLAKQLSFLFDTLREKLEIMFLALTEPKNGTPLETVKYSIFFGTVIDCNFSFLRFGSDKGTLSRPDFPNKSDVVLDDGKTYEKLGRFFVNVKGGYIHYQKNRFHFFTLGEDGKYRNTNDEKEVLRTVIPN